MRKKRTSWNKGLCKYDRVTFIFCGCGCGELIPKYDKKGRRRHFKKTHIDNFPHRSGVQHHNWNRVEVKCSTCKKKIFLIPSRLKKTKFHFCSKECFKIWKIQIQTGKKLLRKVNKRKIIICLWCGKEKEIPLSQLKKSKYHFCSSKCFYAWLKSPKAQEKIKIWQDKRRKIGRKKARISVKCAQCGKEKFILPNTVKKNQKHFFCNFKCLGLFRKNITGKNHHSWKGGPKKVKCAICGREKFVKLFRYNPGNKYYCSLECAHKAMIGEGSPNWNNGSSYEPYPREFSKKFKAYIRAFDNHRCRKCGAPQQEFSKALCIHHINYDKKDNRIENCISLCNYCNLEVNIDREFWKIWFQMLREKDLKEQSCQLKK